MKQNATLPQLLLVDDQVELLDLTACDFANRGFQVFTATGGREALALLDKQNIDIVVSDFQMPNGDGLELLSGVKNRNALTPFVLVSGNADLVRDRARDMGASAVLSKPFDRDELAALIFDHFSQKRHTTT